MATRNEIMAEVTASLTTYECSRQRWEQLRSRLDREEPLMVGDALLTVWRTFTDADGYGPQLFVAAFLRALKPPCTVPLADLLRSLGGWNLSAEEFPCTWRASSGGERVLAESAGDERFGRAAAAVRY